ncbi:MAG: S49 family peptidase, partial [Candidatus Zophobacter franzmannii]|nr:S49 family peptidase [Candidatus Zophobacter franzmannii]
MKPIVVSMGDVAASGGYYISAPCDYIYSDPFTITGSIGVIMMMPDASGLASEIGIKTESISLSKFHGFGNLWKKPSST